MTECLRGNCGKILRKLHGAYAEAAARFCGNCMVSARKLRQDFAETTWCLRGSCGKISRKLHGACTETAARLCDGCVVCVRFFYGLMYI